MNQVLVAEDRAAISLWLEDALADAGCTVAGLLTYCTDTYCADAEEWQKTNTPDLPCWTWRSATDLASRLPEPCGSGVCQCCSSPPC